MNLFDVFKRPKTGSADLDPPNFDPTPLAVNKVLSDIEFLELEIKRWKSSSVLKNMIEGERYYVGDHDILRRTRQAIGPGGELVEIKNLPNNKIIDNQYAKMVDQKTNYLLGQPLTLDAKKEDYKKALDEVFDKSFHRKLKALGENALNCGIAWLYPYYDTDGELEFAVFEPYEILPMWADAEHTKLDLVIRVYRVDVYDGVKAKVVEKVEVYYPDRVEKYELQDGHLIPDGPENVSSYVVFEDESGEAAYSWGRVPLIPFKYNSKEIPLILRVKTLQDGINTMLSDFENNMQEDSRNTILVLKNYEGTDLGEFRHNLAVYGAVKVKTVEGADGGLEALNIAVNADNYKAILELYKKALIENAMGYDAKDDRLSGNPNQMNILSMYSDIDLDANRMETEFQASFEVLLEFLNMHFTAQGLRDFSGDDVRIIFNRDVMMNESEIIDSCAKSVGIISNETIISMHPWVEDKDAELARLKKQEEEEDSYNPFKDPDDDDDEDDPKKNDEE